MPAATRLRCAATHYTGHRGHDLSAGATDFSFVQEGCRSTVQTLLLQQPPERLTRIEADCGGDVEEGRSSHARPRQVICDGRNS
jgi:hypothetical protein